MRCLCNFNSKNFTVFESFCDMNFFLWSTYSWRCRESFKIIFKKSNFVLELGPQAIFVVALTSCLVYTKFILSCRSPDLNFEMILHGNLPDKQVISWSLYRLKFKIYKPENTCRRHFKIPFSANFNCYRAPDENFGMNLHVKLVGEQFV